MHGARLTKRRYGTCHDLEIELRPFAVGEVVDGSVGRDAEAPRRLNGVDIRPEEDKLPAVFRLLMLYHGPDFLRGILAACVFRAVGNNHEHNLFGPKILGRMRQRACDFADGFADCVYQRGGAADPVFALGHGAHGSYVNAVVQQFVAVVEQHRRDMARAFYCLLLLQHGVEPADGVRLQPAHRAAFVKDENELR